jgi:hypothetical protein
LLAQGQELLYENLQQVLQAIESLRAEVAMLREAR